MGKRFYTIDYGDLAIDWMDNVLFTVGEVVRKYPDAVQSVVVGRYKGFRWALQYPKEAYSVLARVDDTLDLGRELDAVPAVKELMITPDTKRFGLGYINPVKWDNVGRDMFRTGLLDKMPEVRNSYTEKFSSNVLPKWIETGSR
jgi:ABC-type nitrate/sulfonate/bicarbonate transport system substrate-binding protein